MNIHKKDSIIYLLREIIGNRKMFRRELTGCDDSPHLTNSPPKGFNYIEIPWIDKFEINRKLKEIIEGELENYNGELLIAVSQRDEVLNIEFYDHEEYDFHFDGVEIVFNLAE